MDEDSMPRIIDALKETARRISRQLQRSGSAEPHRKRRRALKNHFVFAATISMRLPRSASLQLPRNAPCRFLERIDNSRMLSSSICVSVRWRRAPPLHFPWRRK